MIEKEKIKNMLYEYGESIRKRISNLSTENDKLSEAFISIEAKTIWHQSTEYQKTSLEIYLLHEMYCKIVDMICEISN